MHIPASCTIATAEQSRHIDTETTGRFGIDGFTLMEVAGSSAAKELLEEIPAGSHGLFFCGKGNNGGDALVVARYLVQHNIKVTIVFVGGTDDLSPAAEKNYGLLQTIADSDSSAGIIVITEWNKFDGPPRPDFIIDGMLGTGLDSDLRGTFTDAVEWINNTSCPIYAMDIPTGLHADTGQIMGDAVQASQTFAFGMLKQGFYLDQGPEQTGMVQFCELPFPAYLLHECFTYLIDRQYVPEHESSPARHKYEAGVVHIIAGSEGLTGAALMAAQSAWAEGVGAVILVCPRGVLPVFENNLPQIIKKPVGTHQDVCFKEEHLPEVSKIISEKDGPVLLGPGLGREESTVSFANGLLEKTSKEIIIDADGLWALAQKSDWVKPENATWILTPHPGELSTLLNKKLETDHQRLTEVKNTARQKNITLLSKGYPVILGTPSGTAYLSGYDTQKFSRAGFGDVLAGKIAAYCAFNYQPAETCIRALLNGQEKALQLKEQDKPFEPLNLI